MLATRIEGPHTRLQIVLREDGVQSGVDLMQRLVKLRKNVLLHLQALGNGCETCCQSWHEPRRGLVVDSLLPFPRVLVWRRLVEGNPRLVNLVVEVVLEIRRWMVGVPLVI